MTSTSLFRIGVAAILGLTAAGAAVSAQTARPREFRELVVRVLANGRPVTNATVDCRPAGMHDTDKDGTGCAAFRPQKISNGCGSPVPVSDRDRQELIAAMQAPVTVNPLLRPQVLPSPDTVDDIRRSERFALIPVIFNRGIPLGSSGYTMLFERRVDGWVFLCIIDNWIS